MAETKTKFPHLEWMEEESKTMKDFPKEIQDQIRGFNLKTGAYNKKPTPEGYDALVKVSVQISDDMQNWKEKDLPDEADEKVKAEAEEARLKKEKEDAETKSADEKKIADAEAEKNKVKKKGVHDASLEAAVKAKIIDGEISGADLHAIIGTDNLDTWNNKETIGGTTLRKIHLSSRYRIA